MYLYESADPVDPVSLRDERVVVVVAGEAQEAAHHHRAARLEAVQVVLGRGRG